MFHRVKPCMIGLAACLILAIVSVAVAAKPDKPPGKGGGGGGEKGPAIVEFSYDTSEGVQSDNGTPYVNLKKEKMECVIQEDGHLRLITNTGRDYAVGRTLFVDFGQDVTLLLKPNPPTLRTTDDLAIDGIEHKEQFRAGAFGNVDIGDMDVLGDNEPRTAANGTLINLYIRVGMAHPGGGKSGLTIAFDPDYDDHGYTAQEGTTRVTIWRTAVDTWVIENTAGEDEETLLPIPARATLIEGYYHQETGALFTRHDDLIIVPWFQATVTLEP